MNIVILISGKQGSGKTTLAQNLGRIARENEMDWIRMRFAEALYKIHDAILPMLKQLGIIAPTVDKDGDLLQVLGTEYGRMRKGEDVWVDIIRRAVDRAAFLNHPALITIEDARFENEFTKFPDAFRVRLEAPRELRKGRTHAWRDAEEHLSETGLDEIAAQERFDLYLDTDGADEIAAMAQAREVFHAAQTYVATSARSKWRKKPGYMGDVAGAGCDPSTP